MSSGGNTIEIKDLKSTYIITKTDKFDNTICYFKMTDLGAKNKLSPILSQNVTNADYLYGKLKTVNI